MNNIYIGINKSYIKNGDKFIIIYDTNIIKKIGIEAYTSIKNMSPYLYEHFIECDIFNKPYSQLELELTYLNESPENLKKMLVLFTYGGDSDIPLLIKRLPRYSNTFPDDTMMSSPLDAATIIILIILIVIIIVALLYFTGVINKLATTKYKTETTGNFNIDVI